VEWRRITTTRAALASSSSSDVAGCCTKDGSLRTITVQLLHPVSVHFCLQSSAEIL